MTSSILPATAPWPGPRGARAARPRLQPFAWSPTRAAGEALSLAPTGSGWALTGDSGRVVYRAEGPDAHRLCLRRAYEHGVLYLR